MYLIQKYDFLSLEMSSGSVKRQDPPYKRQEIDFGDRLLTKYVFNQFSLLYATHCWAFLDPRQCNSGSCLIAPKTHWGFSLQSSFFLPLCFLAFKNAILSPFLLVWYEYISFKKWLCFHLSGIFVLIEFCPLLHPQPFKVLFVLFQELLPVAIQW